VRRKADVLFDSGVSAALGVLIKSSMMAPQTGAAMPQPRQLTVQPVAAFVHSLNAALKPAGCARWRGAYLATVARVVQPKATAYM
jgi:hypothetical protein